MYNEEVKHRFMRETVASTPYKLKLCESIINSTEQLKKDGEQIYARDLQKSFNRW